MNDSIKKLEQLTAKLSNDPYSSLDGIFKNSVDLLCIIKDDAFFAKVSDSWISELGFSREYLTTTSFFDLMHPDDVESSKDAWQKALTGNITENFKNRYKTASGAYKTLVWSLPAVQNGISFSIARVERQS